MICYSHDFFVFFENRYGNVINMGGVCGIGRLSIANVSGEICENISVSAKSLAKSERLAYWNGSVRMVVYTWRA